MTDLITFGIVAILGVIFLFLQREQNSRIKPPYPLPLSEAVKRFKVNLILIFIFVPLMFIWMVVCLSFEPNKGIALAGSIAILLATLVIPVAYPFFTGKVTLSYLMLNIALLGVSTALWVGVLEPIASELNFPDSQLNEQSANQPGDDNSE